MVDNYYDVLHEELHKNDKPECKNCELLKKLMTDYLIMLNKNVEFQLKEFKKL